jgi:hypothetical protein
MPHNRSNRFGAMAVMGLAVLCASRSSAEECARRFDQLTTGLPDACMFVGRYNPTCGSEAVALFAGDGTALVVSLSPCATAPPLFIAARALSATSGKLVLWRGDLQLDDAPSVGSVHLEDNGRRLVIRLNSGMVSAGGCPVQEFVGRFAGMATAGAGASPRAQPIAALDVR